MGKSNTLVSWKEKYWKWWPNKIRCIFNKLCYNIGKVFNVHTPTWIDFDINLFWIVGMFVGFTNGAWCCRDTSKSWMMYKSNEVIIGMHELINLYLTQWLFVNSKRKGDWKGKENCSHFQVSRVVLISLMMSSLCCITCWPFASNIPHCTTHPFHFYLFMSYQPNDSFDFGVSWWINCNSCCLF